MNVLHISDLEEILSNEFSSELEIAALRALDIAYRLTREHVRPPFLDDPEAKDLRGHYLRACVETYWKRFSAECQADRVESRLNRRRNYYHAWVESGRIHLTASAVADQTAKPRKADFRETYASDGQLSLFDGDQLESDDNGDSIYGVLLYGPSKSLFPKFIKIAFPDASRNRYIPIVDLLNKHPGVVDLGSPMEEEFQGEPMPDVIVTPDEEIQEPELPGLRPIPRRVGEEGS